MKGNKQQGEEDQNLVTCPFTWSWRQKKKDSTTIGSRICIFS